MAQAKAEAATAGSLPSPHHLDLRARVARNQAVVTVPRGPALQEVVTTAALAAIPVLVPVLVPVPEALEAAAPVAAVPAVVIPVAAVAVATTLTVSRRSPRWNRAGSSIQIPSSPAESFEPPEIRA
jgi:hypothetical protein